MSSVKKASVALFVGLSFWAAIGPVEAETPPSPAAAVAGAISNARIAALRSHSICSRGETFEVRAVPFCGLPLFPTSLRDATARRPAVTQTKFTSMNEKFGRCYELACSIDGVRLGEWSAFYEDGWLAGSGEYSGDGGGPKKLSLDTEADDGIRIGLWRWWYRNGPLATSGRYVHGRKDGVWSYWHADGSTARCEEFERGRNIRRLFFDQGTTRRTCDGLLGESPDVSW